MALDADAELHGGGCAILADDLGQIDQFGGGRELELRGIAAVCQLVGRQCGERLHLLCVADMAIAEPRIRSISQATVRESRRFDLDQLPDLE